MHLILHFLQSFSAVDNYGEAAVLCDVSGGSSTVCRSSGVIPQEVNDENDAFKDLPLMNKDDDQGNNEEKEEEDDRDDNEDEDEECIDEYVV